MLTRGSLSRHGFLQRSTAALAASGLPLWYARESAAALDERESRTAKGDKPIVMGAIGTGSRGVGVMQDAQKRGARFVAVCDVDARHREDAVARLKKLGQECSVDQYND